MYCPACGHESPSEARYCASCDASLPALSEGDNGLSHPSSPSSSGDIPARNLGGLLEETFAVYRESFLPFVLISLAPQLPTIFQTVVDELAGEGFPGSLVLSLFSGNGSLD